MYRGKDTKQNWRTLPNFLKIAEKSYLCDDDGFLVKSGGQGMTDIRGEFVEVAACSVGIPTGKKDKKNVEIYTGDIIEVSDAYYLVVSDADGFTAEAVAEGGTDQALTAIFAATTEITGKFADAPVFVSPESSSTTLWGHTVSSLQENIVVSGNAITGTLKYISSGALPDVWGAGNFIALKFLPAGEVNKIRIGLDPSQGSGLVELDEDMNAVCKITDKNKQKFIVETTVGNDVLRQVFDLSSLTLATE